MMDDFDPDLIEWEDHYPEEALEALARSDEELRIHNSIQVTNDFSRLTNDEFLTAIFGQSFSTEHPLVCHKAGDPDQGGWSAVGWPSNTNQPDLNWYFLPSLYRPDETGRFRAKKDLVITVYVVMVDDVGTKVPFEKFENCPPSWAIETSPGNHQLGFIFAQPISDLNLVDELKEKLIDAGLCDKGATGGTARWMRLPTAVNGRPKYGNPSPPCQLKQWRPDLRYTIDELYSKLGLIEPKQEPVSVGSSNPTSKDTPSILFDEISNEVIEALKSKGLYKSYAGSGRHEITCPWVTGHTDSKDSGTYYSEPSQEYPTGGFKCFHSHGSFFHIRQLKEHLGLVDSTPTTTISNQPQKLPPALRPVPALDPLDLPIAIRAAAIDLADRLQCPIDYLVVAMLSAAGAVIGNKVGIFPYANDESWDVYPALWGGVVGDPGSKKSPSLQAAHVPLRHLESLASQRYTNDLQAFEMAMDQHDLDLAVWNKNKGMGMKPTPPVEPKRERYIVHDSTYQALGVILADNPRGILALADELSGLLQSLDASGQEAARGFYLTGWSGTGGYSFDRIGRGSITLDRYCLSVFGGFQPDRIKAYVQLSQRGSSKNDGLLQRFQLLVWPDQLGNIKFVDRTPDQVAIDRYHKAVLSLPDLAASTIVGAKRLPNDSQLLHFDPSAQQLFNSWFLQNEKMLISGAMDSARQSHFAKYRSLVPALALLFHLLDDNHAGPVCEDCLAQAISFAEYLKKHADRIYASVSGHDHAAVRLLAERLLDGQLTNGFTCRTLMLSGWSGLSTKEQAQAAIDALVEFGWLVETEIRSGGRPSLKYALHQDASNDLL